MATSRKVSGVTASILLLDLEPQWLAPNLFAFACPHCRKDWLTCKDAVVSSREQADLYEKRFGTYWNFMVVPCNPEYKWTFSSRNFADITVSPSIDASRARHWHGHIQNGKIVGGL